MSRAKKQETRGGSAHVVVGKEPSAPALGPEEFDPRSNLRGPTLKQVGARHGNLTGQSPTGTRVP
jgi:hypothetical protein